MDALEMMYLITQLRHRTLLQEAERERLINSSIKTEPGNHGIGLNPIAWLMVRRTKNDKTLDLPIEVRRSNDPCCMAGDTRR
jgi:hypothetical protein